MQCMGKDRKGYVARPRGIPFMARQHRHERYKTGLRKALLDVVLLYLAIEGVAPYSELGGDLEYISLVQV